MDELTKIMVDPVEVPYRHQCSVVPNGPDNVQQVLVGMRFADPTFGYGHAFYDRLGRSVCVPRTTNNAKFFDDGYAKALWDYRIGSMLIGEDNETLYVRDVDESGENRLLSSWHSIADIEEEYHITGQKNVYLAWNLQMKVECRKLPRRILRGVKFSNVAFYRVDGHVRRIESDDPLFANSYEVTLDAPYDDELVAQAGRLLRFVTEDDHSAENLGRLFAAPLLQPYLHLFWVIYGGGGNGKGILLGSLRKSFPRLATPVNATALLSRGGGNPFSNEQETLKLIGRLWVFDEDADTISVEQTTLLKKISTGDMLVGRRIRENGISFRNRATLAIASNNPVILQSTEALNRRRVFVRMRDGRKEKEFKELLSFRDRYGAIPFLMASCRLWEVRGDKPWNDVSIGSAASLDDAQQWIVDQIVSNGYAVSQDNPYKESRSGHMNTVSKLGLLSKCKKIDGKVVRVLVVKDERTFAPFRKESAASIQDALAEAESTPVPALPSPREDNPVPTPDDYGFPVTFGTVSEGKKSFDWAKNRTLPVGRRPPSSASAYAVVPAAGMAIIDLDVAKDPLTGEVLKDAPTGWDVFNREIGVYGSPDFPKTYLVGTPTGRANGIASAHAYYLIPDSLRGLLKNSVHEDGVPVDIRCEGKGYVVGAGSHIGNGNYLLLDVPDGNPPVMSPRMVSWLESHNYTSGIAPQQVASACSQRIPSLSEVMERPISIGKPANGRPDMTPIAEGSRNNDLHAWAYGRLSNHPENRTAIEHDLYERGRASGLTDGELSTIWKSIIRATGGAT